MKMIEKKEWSEFRSTGLLLKRAGFIKVSTELWSNKKVRRLVKRVMHIDRIVFALDINGYEIHGRSKYFDIVKEGNSKPQYDFIITTKNKRLLFWRYLKLSIKEITKL